MMVLKGIVHYLSTSQWTKSIKYNNGKSFLHLKHGVVIKTSGFVNLRRRTRDASKESVTYRSCSVTCAKQIVVHSCKI